MKKRYNHDTFVKKYRIRNRFSYKTNIITSDPNNRTLPNDDCIEIHEHDLNNYQGDNEGESEYDKNEDEYGGYEDEYDEYEDRYEDEYDEYEDIYEDEYDEYDYEDEDNEYEDRYEHDNNGDREVDDNNEYENNENNDPIVDASITMPNVNGDFGPYFENTTSALLFCWMQKYNICKLK